MILRDPVHGLVAFESDESEIVEPLLATAELQRLRRIRQLGLASLAYPGADHTRFAHAIGTAHVMKSFIARLRMLHGELPYWQRLTTERARDALAAALLHDLGHGPFSHLFEAAIPHGPRHEEWTRRIVCSEGTEVNRVLRDCDAALPERVASLVSGKHELPYLARAVSGVFDVDRCDYLLRDAHFTGVGYGHFDLDWLLRSLRLGIPSDPSHAPPLAIDGPKGLPAIESFMLSRLFMFQQVYFHKASRASEWMLTQILKRASLIVLDRGRLEAAPRALVSLARDGDASLADYLDLDDTVLWSCLSTWRNTADPTLSDLCQRLYGRRLFKTYELYGEHATPRGRLDAAEIARDIARTAGYEPDIYVGLDVASDTPFDDTDEPLAVIFPGGKQRRPSEVSFLLARLRGQEMQRVRLLFPVELREQIIEALSSL